MPNHVPKEYNYVWDPRGINLIIQLYKSLNSAPSKKNSILHTLRNVTFGAKHNC